MGADCTNAPLMAPLAREGRRAASARGRDSRGLQNRPQVVELVEQVPDVIGGPAFAVSMQVGKRRVVAIAVERRLGFPFDDDEHLPRRDLAGGAFAEFLE